MLLTSTLVIRFYDTDYNDYVDLVTHIVITKDMSEEDILFHAAASRELDMDRVIAVTYVTKSDIPYGNYLRYIPRVVATL